MKMLRWAVAGALATGFVLAADMSTVSTNPDDPPSRVKSGKVLASTDAEAPPALGPSPAKVVLLVFSDFQCPVCKRSAAATDQIAEEFPGDVRVEFWQHPLAMHRNSENAAVASLAAQRQGRFWEYHDALFENQSALDEASLTGYAERLGLDVERFKADYAAPELRTRAQSEAAAAEKFGAHSTPTFMMNGKLHVGWGSWMSFRQDVERELNEANKLVEQGTPIEQIADVRAEAQIQDPDVLRAYRDEVLRPAQDPPKTAKADKKSNKKKVAAGRR